jgi:hypothetical protein
LFSARCPADAASNFIRALRCREQVVLILFPTANAILSAKFVTSIV